MAHIIHKVLDFKKKTRNIFGNQKSKKLSKGMRERFYHNKEIIPQT